MADPLSVSLKHARAGAAHLRVGHALQCVRWSLVSAWRRLTVPLVAALLSAFLISACAKIEMPAHLKPLSRDAMMLLGAKKMASDTPIFIRIFKAESELEVWKQRLDGRFYHFKTYPICTWSGGLGPKLKQGDKQAPEGFYRVNRHRMNPNSKFHLSFNLGYPNRFDKAHRRTGNFLMVHGDCSSAGCYAMTDTLMEEIYALAREAFIGGQSEFWVHAFPFRMTDEAMARHADSKHIAFWNTLKPAYDLFERNRIPPPIAVCERRYVVNAIAPKSRKLKPHGRCPRFTTPDVTPFDTASEDPASRVVVPGVKKRLAMLQYSGSTMMGLTKTQPRRFSPRPSWWSGAAAPRTPFDATQYFAGQQR